MKNIEPLNKRPKIVIPSHNRAGQVRVLDCIPEDLLDQVTIVCSIGQYQEYKKHYPNIRIVESTPHVKTIAQKRQFCLDMWDDHEKIIMLDDKIVLYLKRFEFQANGMPKIPSGEGRYMDRINNAFHDLYNVMDDLLDKYPQVGISPREGNAMREGYGKEIQKVYGAQGLRLDILDQNDIRFDGMYQEDNLCGFYEDYYLTLRLIEEGFGNYGLYDYVYNHVHNAKGGNSGSRTLETQEHCVKYLQKRFGDEFIKIWQYAGASQWDGLPNRWEIKTMYLKKFYNSVQERLNEKSSPNLFDMFGA